MVCMTSRLVVNICQLTNRDNDPGHKINVKN
jgi:hypothetical protein